MAHFAQVDPNGIVVNILVGNNDEPDEGYQWLVDNFCSMEKPTLTWHERTILHTELIHAVHEKQRQLLEKQYEYTGS